MGQGLVSISVRDLWMPNAVAAALQQVADRVLNSQTLLRLAQNSTGASCRIYPQPLGPSLGSISLFRVTQGEWDMASFAVRLYVPTHRGPKGVYLSHDVVQCLRFRLEGTERRRALRRTGPDVEVQIGLPLHSPHPRVLVGGQH